jgi:hypothetical protein
MLKDIRVWRHCQLQLLNARYQFRRHDAAMFDPMPVINARRLSYGALIGRQQHVDLPVTVGMHANLYAAEVQARNQSVQARLRARRWNSIVPGTIDVGLRQPGRLSAERVAVKQFHGAVANPIIAEPFLLHAAQGIVCRRQAVHDVQPHGHFFLCFGHQGDGTIGCSRHVHHG